MKRLNFKTVIVTLMAIGVMSFTACEQEDVAPLEILQNGELGTYIKELTIYDKERGTSVVMTLGCNNRDILDLWTTANIELSSSAVMATTLKNEAITDEPVSCKKNINRRDENVSMMIKEQYFNTYADSLNATIRLVIPDGSKLNLDWHYPVFYSNSDNHFSSTLNVYGGNFSKQSYFAVYYKDTLNYEWIQPVVEWEKITRNTHYVLLNQKNLIVCGKQKSGAELVISLSR